MDPLGRIGTSNEALGGRLRIAFDRPGVVIAALPANTLSQVAARLRA